MSKTLEIEKITLDYKVNGENKKIEVEMPTDELLDAVSDTIRRFEGIRVIGEFAEKGKEEYNAKEIIGFNSCGMPIFKTPEKQSQDNDFETKQLKDFQEDGEELFLVARKISKWCMDDKNKKHVLIIETTGKDAILYDFLSGMIANDIKNRHKSFWFDKVPGLQLVDLVGLKKEGENKGSVKPGQKA